MKKWETRSPPVLLNRVRPLSPFPPLPSPGHAHLHKVGQLDGGQLFKLASGEGGLVSFTDGVLEKGVDDCFDGLLQLGHCAAGHGE